MLVAIIEGCTHYLSVAGFAAADFDFDRRDCCHHQIGYSLVELELHFAGSADFVRGGQRLMAEKQVAQKQEV